MKKIILTWLTAFALLLLTKNAFAQYPIPATLFGINGWMNSFIGDGTNVYNCNGLSAAYEPTQWNCYLGGKVDAIMTGTCSPVVKDLHVNLIRYGGISNDINFPTNDQFINEIDRIRALGAEPIIQIPYYDGKYTATDAGNLLTYLNTTRGKNIKYVEIGNEPDGYPGYPGTGFNDQDRANYIRNYFYPIACSLKVADANVQIIGPSCSWYNAGVYKHLLTSGDAASLIGNDGSGHPVLDIVDIHRYPFDGSQDRPKVIDDPANSTGTYTATCFASILTNGISCTSTITTAGLLDYISCANVSRSSPLKFSVSEMNINWQNASVNTYSTTGTAGFIAGQWMAEMYSVILDKARATSVDVAFIAPWSMQESGGSGGKYDYGIFDNNSACTPSKRSTYEHLAAMGQYFKGSFYKGTNNAIGNVKQFGTVQSNGGYVIMLLNEDDTNTYPYTINTGTSTVGTTSLVVTLGTPTNYTYTYSTGIAPKTTHLVFLNCSGGLIKTEKYDENLASTHGTFTTIATGSGNLPVLLTTSVSNTGCTTFTNTGSASVTATGGTAPYSYTWSPAGFTGGNTATYSNLIAGTYTVAVSSSNTLCTAPQTATVVVAKGSPLVTISTPTSANSCAATQSFTSSVTGGTSPYTYSWSGGGGTGSVSATYTQSTTLNTVNEYTVTVTDARGCVNTALCSHYANHSSSLTVTGTSSANNCCYITLTATPYIPGATYSWKKNGVTLNPSLYPTAATHILYDGLGPGTYSVTATPGNLDPCSSSIQGSKVVAWAGGNPCNCPQGPFGRLAEPPAYNSEIIALVPNPANSTTTVQISLESSVKTARLIITDVLGKMIANYPVRTDQTETLVDCQSLRDGLYFCSLIVDDTPVSVKKLMVVK